MINDIDYRKYLSIDKGNGILLSSNDVEVMDKYSIDYSSCTSLKMLIFLINDYLDNGYYEDAEDLEAVLMHLEELFYYSEVKK